VREIEGEKEFWHRVIPMMKKTQCWRERRREKSRREGVREAEGVRK
jgi:hypothetical protein